MARTSRVKKSVDARYHVISRIAGKRFLLSSPSVKREMVEILARVAEFSGVYVFAYCVMDNHFHIVCKVLKEPLVAESEVIRRIAVLKGNEAASSIAEHLAELRSQGRDDLAELELDRWRRRMNDLSEFVKTFKETFDRAYRRRNPYNGSFWDGRFRSTCVESGDYLHRVTRYVNYNPVRAGIVSQSVRYAWCTDGSADAFAAKCRRALAAELGGQTPEARAAQLPADGGQTSVDGLMNGGLSPELRGQLPEAVWLMRRMPQFGSGKLFGSLRFVLSGIDEAGWGGRRRPHGVPGGGFSSHGHRLADQAA